MTTARIPDDLRRKAVAHGDACRRWVDDLDALIADLEDRWQIRVGSTLDGGTASFVADATRADGTPAVIKLVMPAGREGRSALEREVRVLRRVDGRGCVRVLDHDPTMGAVLLERLGRQLIELGLPVRTQLEIICSTLAQVWAVPADIELPSGDDHARWSAEIIGQLWEELDRPCPARVVDRAIALAHRRSAAFDAETAVLAHGDAHAWNTLEHGRPGTAPFTLVDPDGLVAEREYDLAISMREFTDELVQGDAVALGRDRARTLARLTATDEQKIWEWGIVERVSNGLLTLMDGDAELGRTYLRIAELWADDPD